MSELIRLNSFQNSCRRHLRLLKGFNALRCDIFQSFLLVFILYYRVLYSINHDILNQLKNELEKCEQMILNYS